MGDDCVFCRCSTDEIFASDRNGAVHIVHFANHAGDGKRERDLYLLLCLNGKQKVNFENYLFSAPCDFSSNEIGFLYEWGLDGL